MNKVNKEAVKALDIALTLKLYYRKPKGKSKKQRAKPISKPITMTGSICLRSRSLNHYLCHPSSADNP